MANTINQTTLVQGKKKIVRYVTLVSDGTEETDLVIYDSSALNTVDPLTCKIVEIAGVVQILDNTAVDVSVYLEFDATTDVHAISLPIGRPFCLNFDHFGGLKNYAGSGITGDIVLTTTGLEAGDRIALAITVDPN